MHAHPPSSPLTNLHPFRPIDRRNDRFAFIATTDDQRTSRVVLCLVGRKGHLLVYLALHQSGLLQNKPTAAGKHYEAKKSLFMLAFDRFIAFCGKICGLGVCP